MDEQNHRVQNPELGLLLLRQACKEKNGEISYKANAYDRWMSPILQNSPYILGLRLVLPINAQKSDKKYQQIASVWI